MPSFSNASPRQWAQVRASTSIFAYQVMEGLKEGPKAKSQFDGRQLEVFDDLIEAEWISEGDDGQITLTDTGRAHLKSF